MEYKNIAIMGGILFALVFTFTNSDFPILEGYTRLFILGCCLLSGFLFLMNYVLVQPKPNIDTRHIPNRMQQPTQQVPRQPTPPDSDIAMMIMSHPPIPSHPNTDAIRLGEKIKKMESKKLLKYPEDEEEDIFGGFK